MLSSQRYDQIELHVDRLLRKYDLPIFPISVQNILHSMPNIELKFYHPLDSIHSAISDDGYTEWNGSTPTIYICYQENIKRVRFTIAHEIGHIKLQHHRNTEISMQEKEQEANYFASRLLVPVWAIHYLEVKSPEIISDVFCVSYQCAELRFRQYLKWTACGCPLNDIAKELSSTVWFAPERKFLFPVLSFIQQVPNISFV